MAGEKLWVPFGWFSLFVLFILMFMGLACIESDRIYWGAWGFAALALSFAMRRQVVTLLASVKSRRTRG